MTDKIEITPENLQFAHDVIERLFDADFDFGLFFDRPNRGNDMSSTQENLRYFIEELQPKKPKLDVHVYDPTHADPSGEKVWSND